MASSLSITKALALVTLLASMLASQALAMDYFVSPDGDDAQSGRSPAQAWRSVAAVNTRAFRARDRILFKGGATFQGGLIFNERSHGNFLFPIVVGSYGSGRATLKVTSGDGILLHNSNDFEIRDLNISGSECHSEAPDPQGCQSGSDCRYSSGDGILAMSDHPGTRPLRGVHIHDVDVGGFASPTRDGRSDIHDGGHGIAIRAKGGAPGYRGVTIENVSAHDNSLAGVAIVAPFPLKPHSDIHLRHVSAFNNPGLPGASAPTGSGIVLGGVSHGVVEASEAHDNGCFNDWHAGPVGIWAFASDHLLFEQNVAYRNHSRHGSDGGGFDFDGGVTDSVMRHNLSYENDGPGYLLAQFPLSAPTTRDVVEDNVSINDARKNSYGAILFWGQIDHTVIQRNLVSISPSKRGNPYGLRFYEWTGTDVKIHDNRFFTRGGVPLVSIDSGDQPEGKKLSLDRNLFSSCGEPFHMDFDGKSYGNLTAFLEASQLESGATREGAVCASENGSEDDLFRAGIPAGCLLAGTTQ